MMIDRPKATTATVGLTREKSAVMWENTSYLSHFTGVLILWLYILLCSIIDVTPHILYIASQTTSLVHSVYLDKIREEEGDTYRYRKSERVV